MRALIAVLSGLTDHNYSQLVACGQCILLSQRLSDEQAAHIYRRVASRWHEEPIKAWLLS